MRVTSEVKQATDRAIRVAAMRLFGRQGFEGTSTREIAAAAGIATGTLFNYYATKEELALELIAGALEGACGEFRGRLEGGGIRTLEEALFALVAAGLRALAPLRPAVGQVLEAGLSPFSTGTGADGAGARMRAGQLEEAGMVLARFGVVEPGVVAMHLYWTLYLGVLAFWAADGSPNQEDTLAMLDQAVWMFVSAVRRGGSRGDGAALGSRDTQTEGRP